MRWCDSGRGCGAGRGGQTLANVYLALDHDLDVMPVINKVDLPSAQPDEVVKEIEDVIGIEAEDAPRISAKTGLNVDRGVRADRTEDSGAGRRSKSAASGADL